MNDMELIDEIVRRADEHQKQKEKEFAISELEKLRSELHETAEMHCDGDYYLRDEWIDEYVNNHISKLKGENK